MEMQVVLLFLVIQEEEVVDLVVLVVEVAPEEEVINKIWIIYK